MSSCWAYKSFRCFCVPYRKQYNPAIFILKLNVVSTACQWLIRPQFYGMYTFHFGKQFFMLECACHMGLSVSLYHTPFQRKLNTKKTKKNHHFMAQFYVLFGCNCFLHCGLWKNKLCEYKISQRCYKLDLVSISFGVLTKQLLLSFLDL